MNKYKVVIVDDDEVAIGKLSDALKKNPRFSIEELREMISRERNL